MYDINSYINDNVLDLKDTNLDKWNEFIEKNKLIYKSKISINMDIDNNCNKENNSYILKYNKDKLDKETEYKTYGKIRSIICCKKKLIGYSPPKSLNFKEFTSLYPITECYAEDFIEGTMINVFYNPYKEEWEIATKSSVGGEVFFYNKNKTFNKLFIEACSYCKLNINNLPKKYSYTFILQHPENKIVLPINYPFLFLIKVYEINDFKIKQIDLQQFMFNYNNLFNNNQGTCIGIPRIYPIHSYEELINHFASINSSYLYPGIMIYHISGERTKIRNPAYENIKFLRGNQPELLYQYLTLRQKNKVKDYLHYFPENKNKLNKFRNILHQFTETLRLNYIDCFIHKNFHLKEYPLKYRIHMYNLHQIYLNDLKNDNKYINKYTVINYINSLDPAQIMYALNLDNTNN